MKKMKTFFKKDPNDLGRVINEVDPGNDWVFTDGVPTVKYDGTSCAIIDGEIYKRYDAKINKKTGKRRPIPVGAIPCQEPDPYGSWPHWVKCQIDKPEDKYHIEAAEKLGVIYDDTFLDGTYELCGPKINGNREKLNEHKLIKHGENVIKTLFLDFNSIKSFLEKEDIEGIVFHHKTDGRMCKIRKTDFGIKR